MLDYAALKNEGVTHHQQYESTNVIIIILELIKQHPNKDGKVADELISEVVDVLSSSHQNRTYTRKRGNRSVRWQKGRPCWSFQ